MSLRESCIFRSSPYTSGPGSAGLAGAKKAAPTVNVAVISEAKFPVNVPLYGGQSHRMELSCQVSPQHTTTTLTSARHIDISYVVTVKAVMGGNGASPTGGVSLDLPVIMSNWQRGVSMEAIRCVLSLILLSLFVSSFSLSDHYVQTHRPNPIPLPHSLNWQFSYRC
jgi:hypothetical protein